MSLPHGLGAGRQTPEGVASVDTSFKQGSLEVNASQHNKNVLSNNTLQHALLFDLLVANFSIILTTADTSSLLSLEFGVDYFHLTAYLTWSCKTTRIFIALHRYHGGLCSSDAC